MSEHTMSEIPATPMDAIKQIYELFQTRRNFTTGFWARDYMYAKVTTNDADACCWCLGGAIFHVYNLDADILDADIIDEPLESLPINLNDTFKLLWEKLPPYSKIGSSYRPFPNYISSIAQFNDEFGYTGVMRLLQAVIDNTEYAGGVDV